MKWGKRRESDAWNETGWALSGVPIWNFQNSYWYHAGTPWSNDCAANWMQHTVWIYRAFWYALWNHFVIATMFNLIIWQNKHHSMITRYRQNSFGIIYSVYKSRLLPEVTEDEFASSFYCKTPWVYLFPCSVSNHFAIATIFYFTVISVIL